MIQDRVLNGAIAGVAGAMFQNAYAFIMKFLGYSGPFYIDYGKVLLFYRPQPKGLLPDGLGLLAHIVWDVILTVVFAYLLRKTSDRYPVLKGLLYGLSVWFFIKAGSTLYKIPIIVSVRPPSVLFFCGGAVLYGLIITMVLKLLDHDRFKI